MLSIEVWRIKHKICWNTNDIMYTFVNLLFFLLLLLGLSETSDVWSNRLELEREQKEDVTETWSDHSPYNILVEDPYLTKQNEKHPRPENDELRHADQDVLGKDLPLNSRSIQYENIVPALNQQTTTDELQRISTNETNDQRGNCKRGRRQTRKQRQKDPNRSYRRVYNMNDWGTRNDIKKTTVAMQDVTPKRQQRQVAPITPQKTKRCGMCGSRSRGKMLGANDWKTRAETKSTQGLTSKNQQTLTTDVIKPIGIKDHISNNIVISKKSINPQQHVESKRVKRNTGKLTYNANIDYYRKHNSDVWDANPPPENYNLLNKTLTPNYWDASKRNEINSKLFTKLRIPRTVKRFNARSRSKHTPKGFDDYLTRHSSTTRSPSSSPDHDESDTSTTEHETTTTTKYEDDDDENSTSNEPMVDSKSTVSYSTFKDEYETWTATKSMEEVYDYTTEYEEYFNSNYDYNIWKVEGTSSVPKTTTDTTTEVDDNKQPETKADVDYPETTNPNDEERQTTDETTDQTTRNENDSSQNTDQNETSDQTTRNENDSSQNTEQDENTTIDPDNFSIDIPELVDPEDLDLTTDNELLTSVEPVTTRYGLHCGNGLSQKEIGSDDSVMRIVWCNSTMVESKHGAGVLVLSTYLGRPGEEAPTAVARSLFDIRSDYITFRGSMAHCIDHAPTGQRLMVPDPYKPTFLAPRHFVYDKTVLLYGAGNKHIQLHFDRDLLVSVNPALEFGPKGSERPPAPPPADWYPLHRDCGNGFSEFGVEYVTPQGNLLRAACSSERMDNELRVRRYLLIDPNYHIEEVYVMEEEHYHWKETTPHCMPSAVCERDVSQKCQELIREHTAHTYQFAEREVRWKIVDDRGYGIQLDRPGGLKMAMMLADGGGAAALHALGRVGASAATTLLVLLLLY